MKISKHAFGLAALLLGGMLTPASAAAEGPTATAVRINFDTGTAPCSWRATAPLKDEYARLGVHFGDAGLGGKVLDQCARFDYGTVLPAHSHRQFLAFNKKKAGIDYQQVKFPRVMSHFRLWVAEAHDAEDRIEDLNYVVQVYRGGQVVDGLSAVTNGFDWEDLSLDTRAGFDSMRIECYTCTGSFLIDDLVVS